MKLVHVVSPSAAAGKTVFTVALVRVLRAQGLRVGVFKPVGEASGDRGSELGEAAMHLAAAAGCEPCSNLNPLMVRPRSSVSADLWLHGRHIGEAPRLGRDMVVLDKLSPALRREIQAALVGSLEAVAKNRDLVVAEGAGGLVDLALAGAWDPANVWLSELAAGTVLVARHSQGGALAGIAGAAALLDAAARTRLRGFVINDVRALQSEVVGAAQRVAEATGIPFLGAVPFIPWFEDRPRYAPSTPGSEEDHAMLARFLCEAVDVATILAWTRCGSVP